MKTDMTVEEKNAAAAKLLRMCEKHIEDVDLHDWIVQVRILLEIGYKEATEFMFGSRRAA